MCFVHRPGVMRPKDDIGYKVMIQFPDGSYCPAYDFVRYREIEGVYSSSAKMVPGEIYSAETFRVLSCMTIEEEDVPFSHVNHYGEVFCVLNSLIDAFDLLRERKKGTETQKSMAISKLGAKEVVVMVQGYDFVESGVCFGNEVCIYKKLQILKTKEK
jgi:hypothetical protein